MFVELSRIGTLLPSLINMYLLWGPFCGKGMNKMPPIRAGVVIHQNKDVLAWLDRSMDKLKEKACFFFILTKCFVGEFLNGIWQKTMPWRWQPLDWDVSRTRGKYSRRREGWRADFEKNRSLSQTSGSFELSCEYFLTTNPERSPSEECCLL